MFSVPLAKLKAADGVPFPLFLFLKRSERFIPIRLPGDPIGEQKFNAFLQRNHSELWVPNNFQDIFQSYLQYVERTGAPVDTIEEAVAKVEAAASAAGPVLSAGNKPKSEEARLVGDVLRDEELSS